MDASRPWCYCRIYGRQGTPIENDSLTPSVVTARPRPLWQPLVAGGAGGFLACVLCAYQFATGNSTSSLAISIAAVIGATGVVVAGIIRRRKRLTLLGLAVVAGLGLGAITVTMLLFVVLTFFGCHNALCDGG